MTDVNALVTDAEIVIQRVLDWSMIDWAVDIPWEEVVPSRPVPRYHPDQLVDAIRARSQATGVWVVRHRFYYKPDYVAYSRQNRGLTRPGA